MDRFKTGIIGAATPQGAELVRLISEHPMCDLTAVSSSSLDGKTLAEALPRFRGRSDMTFVSENEVIENADVVFNADNMLDAQDVAAACINQKSVLIDLSPEFRYNDADLYAIWHGGEYRYPALHNAAVYCVPELLRERLAGKVLVSCPGAIAAGALLALVPALLEDLIQPDGIVISACVPSVAVNGGRGTTDAYSLTSYTAGEPVETGEIESILSAAADARVSATVMPSVVPTARGMMVCCRAATRVAGSDSALRAAYEKQYGSEHFIRLLPSGESPSTAEVENTNFCDISITRVERTGSVVITAAYDYYLKGSAGQAVQNMNALLNMPEYFGLDFAPGSSGGN